VICHLAVFLYPQIELKLTVPAAPGLAISASPNKSQGASEPVGVSGTLDVFKQLLREYQVKVPGSAPPVLCLDEANAMQSWTSEADLKDRKAVMNFLVNVSSASIVEGCIEIIWCLLAVCLAYIPPAGHDEPRAVFAFHHSFACLR
jgi:hypothetical protein